MANLSINPSGINPYERYQRGFADNPVNLNNSAVLNNKVNNNLQYDKVQISVKCPHGFPGGGCPVCTGQSAGGGGGGSATAKKATGMSWSEAFSVWNMLRKSQLNKMQDLQTLETLRQANMLEQNVIFSTLAQKLLSANSFIQNNIAVLSSIINQLKLALLLPAEKFFDSAKLTTAKLIGVVDKLTAVLGEKIKLAMEKIEETAKEILAQILASETFVLLTKVYRESKEAFQEFLEKKKQAVKEKVRKTIRHILSMLDERRQKNTKNQDEAL